MKHSMITSLAVLTLSLTFTAGANAQSVTPGTTMDNTPGSTTSTRTDSTTDRTAEDRATLDRDGTNTDRTSMDDDSMDSDSATASNRLPSTASPLWLMMLANGAGLVVVASGIRRLRRNA